MAVVADQIVGGTLAGAARTEQPALRRLRAREPHAAGCAKASRGSCEALAGAARADHRLIDCPALIVTGDEDGVGPPECRARACRTIWKRPRRRPRRLRPLDAARKAARMLAAGVRVPSVELRSETN